MAAILPHLEQEDETTELQEKYWTCRSRDRGLGELGDGLPYICPTPQSVVNQSHAMLLDMARMRQYLAQEVRDRTLSLGYRKDGEVVLTLDEPVLGPEWNPTAQPMQRVRVLGWTSKMQTPSFSIPAGARQLGGSCPGSRAGQSIVPAEERNRAAKILLPVLKAKKVNLAECICEFCYAEKGKYSTASVSWGQMMRYSWAIKALDTNLEGNLMTERDPATRKIHRKRPIEESAFVQVLIDAINKTDFKLGSEPGHFERQRFFRIHDSGDFFSVVYLKAWKAIADHFAPGKHDDPIIFWAPTRIWALGPGLGQAPVRAGIHPIIPIGSILAIMVATLSR